MQFDIAQRIYESHHGAKFIKVDLHIHTPASNDYKDKSVTAEQIVNAALDANLGMIAITDHNSVEFCEEVIVASKGKNLKVLPGFELSVWPGYHLLCLFPSVETSHISIADYINNIRNILTRSRIDSKNFGVSEHLTDKDVPYGKIFSWIHELGGIAIPAHVELDGSGLCGRIGQGISANDVLNACSIVEIKRDLPDIIQNRLNGVLDCHAIIRNSDAHTLSAIGNNEMWIKMDDISINGLRQIELEPRGRIAYTEPKLEEKPHILGMWTNGGILKDNVIPFNADLNCVIGGRGVGKSTVIDYLRFVFSSEPNDEQLIQRLRKRQFDIIQNTATICALVYDGDEYYLYERTTDILERKQGSTNYYDIQSSLPQSYLIDWGNKDVIEVEHNFQPEIYSQGEVQSLTDTVRPARQLKLIDDYARNSIEQRRNSIRELIQNIEVCEKDISDTREEIETLKLKISKLTEINERIEAINNVLENFDNDNNDAWRNNDNRLKQLWEHFEAQVASIESLNIVLPQKIVWNDVSQSDFQDLLTQLETEITDVLAGVKANIEETIIDLKSKHNNLVANKDKWVKEKRKIDEEWETMLREQGAGNFAQLNSERQKLEGEQDKIEKKHKPRLTELEIELNNLLGKRQGLLKDLKDNRDRIRNARRVAAKKISSQLDNVNVELKSDKNLDAYLTLLDEIAPTGIRSRDDQLQKLVENIEPNELCELIQSNDTDELMKKTGITDNTAKLLCDIVADDLMKLERIVLDDSITIYLVRNGQNNTLDRLSVGEQCSAVLSIVLVTNRHKPLIIDQPEDELDHDFIMSDVISKFTAVKIQSDPLDDSFQPEPSRQYIVVTHNQNVPVLGDAEMVIKMASDTSAKICKPDSSKGLDHPDTITHVLGLEGGREAFMRRQRRYDGYGL